MGDEVLGIGGFCREGSGAASDPLFLHVCTGRTGLYPQIRG